MGRKRINVRPKYKMKRQIRRKKGTSVPNNKLSDWIGQVMFIHIALLISNLAINSTKTRDLTNWNIQWELRVFWTEVHTRGLSLFHVVFCVGLCYWRHWTFAYCSCRTVNGFYFLFHVPRKVRLFVQHSSLSITEVCLKQKIEIWFCFRLQTWSSTWNAG